MSHTRGVYIHEQVSTHALWASHQRVNIKGERLFGKGESFVSFKSEIFTKSEFLFLKNEAYKIFTCQILVYNSQICPKDYLSPLKTHSLYTIIENTYIDHLHKIRFKKESKPIVKVKFSQK